MQLTEMNIRLQFATDTISELTQNLQAQELAHNTLRAETHTTIINLQTQLTAKTQNSGYSKPMQLMDAKAFTPTVFSGGHSEHFKPFAKRMRAYCNAQCNGFRKIMEWAEAEQFRVDEDVINTTKWEHGVEANHKLYDFLTMVTAGDALGIVESYKDQGFEAWRQLCRRYTPRGGRHELARMSLLLRPKQCKDLSEVPAAVDVFERSIKAYEERGGSKFPEEFKTPLLLQMLPDKHQEELELKYAMGEKHYSKLLNKIMDLSIEYRFRQQRYRGRNDMEVDALS